MLSNKKKALIHVAKARVGMTDDEYRAMLSSVGAASSVELDWRGFKVVMERFEALGFKRERGKEGKRENKPAPSSKEKLLGKIGAVLADLGLPGRYAEAMAKTMFDVDLLVWCTPDQLRRIVAALTYHQRRKLKKEAG